MGGQNIRVVAHQLEGMQSRMVNHRGESAAAELILLVSTQTELGATTRYGWRVADGQLLGCGS
jgi:hypothetical protein